ncbi:hypothetical protein MLD38_039473 [Melastoma candidum]|uniref:Uncharacterized protein n=1 Tax=Melastoma candidum TaxID=119954 RepID=A0ACB9L274_9MYRT|nr:hypothetical protein MLD38_039473 [Melastoma candidum]
MESVEEYVDWRKRPASKHRHGGMLSAFFVLCVEVLENMAYLATASNLVLYLTEFMRFPPSVSANIVTNFMGTAFLLALLGGFLADAFMTTYTMYLISSTLEFLGLLVLVIQSHRHSSKSWSSISLASKENPGREAGSKNTVVLFLGLYLVALGVGGIKGSLSPHGAEQFDETTLEGRKKRSEFFNYYIFCLSCGALMAVTFVVWIEDNLGWQWGFGISAAAILTSILVFLLGSSTYRIKSPSGSPIMTMFKVVMASVFLSHNSRNPQNVVSSTEMTSPSCTIEASKINHAGAEATGEIMPAQSPAQTSSLKFFNRATQHNPHLPRLQCTTFQVESVKGVLGILPIFMSTVMLNCCLAQLSTFSVQQAATMNTRLGFTVPPASLPVFPVLFIMILAPTYNHVVLPFARRKTGTEMGITHLQRIGTGLVLSVIAMAVAALVEMKRKRVAFESGLVDSSGPLPITFLWIALQYLFLGSADLFTLAGMMEFLFTEMAPSMRSLATALSWASLAMGYYLSSVLVSAVNHVTAMFSHTPWLSGNNLNHYKLDRFYWLMCVLSGINFLHYLFWARRYEYSSVPVNDSSDQHEKQPDHEV